MISMVYAYRGQSLPPRTANIRHRCLQIGVLLQIVGAPLNTRLATSCSRGNRPTRSLTPVLGAASRHPSGPALSKLWAPRAHAPSRKKLDAYCREPTTHTARDGRSAFKGSPDMGGYIAPIISDAFDPTRTFSASHLQFLFPTNRTGFGLSRRADTRHSPELPFGT
jgi:hypothetical protein